MSYSVLYTDEKTEGKLIEERGFGGDSLRWREVYLLAKYLRLEYGYGRNKIRNIISYNCESEIKGFNAFKYKSSIDTVVKAAMKKNEYVIDKDVFITDTEISKIQTIKNFFLQKVALVVLFMVKRGRGDVFKLSEVNFISPLFPRNVSKRKIRIALSELQRMKFLKRASETSLVPTYRSDEGLKIIEIYNVGQALNLVNEYVKFCGGELKFCRRCKQSFHPTTTSHVLCDECKRKSYKKRHEVYNKKRRSKNV